MASAKQVFKALSHVDEVWIKGSEHYLSPVQGAEYVKRGDIDLTEEDDEDHVITNADLKGIEGLVNRLKDEVGQLNDNLASKDEDIDSLTATISANEGFSQAAIAGKDKEIAGYVEEIRILKNTVSQLEENLKAKPKK